MACSTLSSRQKKFVVKVTPCLATGRHVTLPFTLQAVSGHFPPLGGRGGREEDVGAEGRGLSERYVS